MVNNGNLVVVGDGGLLPFSTPTPGEITTTQSPAYDEWIFNASQSGPVSISVNPGSSGATAATSPQIKRVRIELRDSTGATLLKSIDSTTDNSPISLDSDSLTNGTGYRIRVLSMTGSVVPGNYVITLLNSGTGETGLSIAYSGSDSISKAEGNSSTTAFKYNVTRIGDLTIPSTVSWSVAGSGTDPASASDFAGGAFPSGSVSFVANDVSNSREITINVAGDTTFERDEAFAVTLSNPSSRSAILVGSAVSTIANDDLPDNGDLIVSSISPPTAARSGQNVVLGWNEKNESAVSVFGDWTTNLKVTRRSTGTVLVDRNILFPANSLAAKASVNRTANFDLPDGVTGTGDFDIAITVDSANNIAEENVAGNAETNNRTTSSFNATIGNYPELSVTQIQLPANVQLSVPFDVTWTVLNSGTASLTKATSDRIYLSANSTVDAGDRILATVSSSNRLPLAANASYSQTASVTLPLDPLIVLGNYQVIVVSDYLNDQFELDESNNQRTTAVSVGLPPLPDLIVESISTKDTTVSGQSVELSWTLKNQGTAPAAGTWSDRIYLSDDAIIGNDLELISFPVSTTLAAGGTVVRTQTIQIPSSVSGVDRFVVATDIGNTIVEFNKEGSNVSIDDATITIDAKPSPNLIVSSVTSLTTGLFSGQPATVDWVVKNIGNTATSSGWLDAVYLSTDSLLSNNDTLLGRVQNASYLNENESYRSNLTAQIPDGAQGTYYFIVVTDSNGQVTETGGENDNTKASPATSITLTPPPDLRVTTITHPREATEGDSIKINWTVLNDGTGETRPSKCH